MKLPSLEALRGVASWVVFLSHFTLGFMPSVLGAPGPFGLPGLAATPLYFMVNGKAAVYVFFVLSGYVLTFRHFRSPSYRALAIGMVKRWPRLAGPVLVTVLAAMACFALDLYFNEQAAPLAGSDWLATGARTPVGAGFEPSWSGAVGDALVRTFLGAGSQYDTSLWTMRVELFGSYLVWMLAVVLGVLPGQSIAFALLPVAIFWASLLSGLCAAFVAGVALAYLHANGVFAMHRLRVSILMIVAAAVLMSVQAPNGWLSALRPLDLDWRAIRPCAWTLAALMLIHAILYNEALRNQGAGRFGQWLGRLSFPVYLVHAVVLATVSSWTFVALRAWPAHLAVGATLVVTVAAVVAVSVPLAWFDEWWTRVVTRAATNLVERFAGTARLVAGRLAR